MSSPPLPPVHFLLVDDLDENLLALDALLRRDGLVLLRARSGTEALEHLLRYDIALAIVDVQMPGMNGFELAELMRGSERTRRVPIIFVTAGTADRQRRFRGYEAGAVDFLHKPIDADILRSKASVFFDLYRQRQEVALQRDELRAATEENARLLRESQWQAEALREADRQKDEFLAVLAHELRNPLGPVRNAIEILRLAGTSQEMVESAREIVSRQVAHMARLIDDLLDVARIARGKVRLRTERSDLAAIVRQTAEDYRPTLRAAGIDLQVNVPEQSLPLVCDPTRLTQVVGNLLHNAAKFTPSGGIVQVRTELDPAGGLASVTVEDSGVGLDADVLSRLFEPFNQASQGLDREKGGLGLGLALVKGLVELHGGSVSAASDGLNRGARFQLTFPLQPKSDDEAPSKPNASEPAQRSLRILIIEDNRDAAESLATLLRFWGHVVDVAFNGVAGLEAARQVHPDVVLSDLGLPGATDGFSVAKAIRGDTELAATHLVALSGYGQEGIRRQAEEAGFNSHLVKPVELAALQEALRPVALGDIREES